MRGAEKRPRRTFWLGTISPPFGLVQRPALAHFNRSDTVDISSITFYSFPRGHILEIWTQRLRKRGPLPEVGDYAPRSGAHSRARRGRICPHEGSNWWTICRCTGKRSPPCFVRAVGDNVGRNVLFRPLDVPFPASVDSFHGSWAAHRHLPR